MDWLGTAFTTTVTALRDLFQFDEGKEVEDTEMAHSSRSTYNIGVALQPSDRSSSRIGAPQQAQYQSTHQVEDSPRLARREMPRTSHSEGPQISRAGAQSSNRPEPETDYSRLVEEHQRLYARAKQLIREKSSLTQQITQAMAATGRKEEEKQLLQSQLNALKHQVASMNRDDGQLTDVELRDKMVHLANEVTDWSLNTFRKAKIVPNLLCVGSYSREKVLEAVPSFRNSCRTLPKLQTCQAVVGMALVGILTSGILFPHHILTDVAQSEQHIKGMARQPEQYNEWRAVTYKILLTISDEEFLKCVESRCTEAVHAIQQCLEELMQCQITEPSCRKLESIVLGTLKLSRDVRMQRANLIFEHRVVGIFSTDCMVDANGSEAPEAEGRMIDVALFPGLRKLGDERGANIDLHNNVICKARVAVLGDE